MLWLIRGVLLEAGIFNVRGTCASWIRGGEYCVGPRDAFISQPPSSPVRTRPVSPEFTPYAV